MHANPHFIVNLSRKQTMPVKYKPAPCSQEKIKEVFDYNPETGDLIWASQFGSRAALGSVAGTVTSYGYKRIKILGKLHMAHRLVWLWYYGEWPKEQIDHVNGDKLDNRIKNLRLATIPENGQNSRVRSSNTHGYLGVSRSSKNNKSKPWKAEIVSDNKKHYLGIFSTPEEAHAAYVEAKARLHTFQPVPRT